MIKFILVFIFLASVVFLVYSFIYLMKGKTKDNKKKVVQGLTLRITTSVILIALATILILTGSIQVHPIT